MLKKQPARPPCYGTRKEWLEKRVVVPIIIVQYNSLFIYVLSSTAGGQLQSQHGI
jgi:hypothetical protein